MVELLKRNHDVMMEKYEVFRQRNETLEKNQQDKEKLYLSLKTENDSLASQLYEAKRNAEDARQEKYLYETKLRSGDTSNKELNEQVISLRKQKEQFEGQLKVVSEQLEVLQKSHDMLAAQKTQETELLSRETSTVGA